MVELTADYSGPYKEKVGDWIFQYKFFDPTMDKGRATQPTHYPNERRVNVKKE